MIVNEGSTYRVDQPEVVTMVEAIDDFPSKERKPHHLDARLPHRTELEVRSR